MLDVNIGLHVLRNGESGVYFASALQTLLKLGPTSFDQRRKWCNMLIPIGEISKMMDVRRTVFT